MAGTSPRRSSRARTTQPQSQHSSATSSTSGRPERSTRSFNKTGSPQKSTPSASLSSEPPDDLITVNNDPLPVRRRTRGQDEERDRIHPKIESVEMANDSEQEEEEAVRCICGQEDYPGPPPKDEDTKHGAKESIDYEPLLSPELAEDLAGFFVQCDICKVWQHGGCVGIMSEESSPDEYFCDQCRKDFHKIYTANNGQRYSHYLPIARPSRATSRAASLAKDGTRSPKSKETRSARQSSLAQASKRRSTMNSRDAAYDEEEQLRRAIEESKADAIPDQAENGTKRTKRGRSDSEEKPESAKRQRTSSRSASPADDKAAGESQDESDDGSTTKNGSRKPRSVATRNQKEKSEREERERQRAEAASKRKGRAERRRAEDSDPSEELPLAARAATKATTAATAPPSAPTTSAAAPAAVASTEMTAPEPPQPAEAPPSSQPTPDTPPAGSVPQASSKSKRSHQRKGKGRNQYTKDRDGHDEPSPARSQSRDVQNNDHNAGHTKATDHGRSHGRTKGGFNSKVSMTELKRRATAMFDFISKTQLELAGEITPPNQASRQPSEPPADGVPQIAVNGGDAPPNGKPPGSAGSEDTAPGGEARSSRDFKDLNCVEMMDSLTRDLVKWQKEFVA